MKNEESSKRKKKGKERKGKERKSGAVSYAIQIQTNKQTNKPDKHTEKKLDRQNGMGDRI